MRSLISAARSRRVLLLACALALGCAHGRDAEAPRTRLPDAQALSHGGPSLWTSFEAEEGHPRLLLLVSPT